MNGEEMIQPVERWKEDRDNCAWYQSQTDIFIVNEACLRI